MKHFRYILLCLSLIAAVGLMVGCSCGNPQDETSASTPAESGSTGMTESQTQESTRETMPETSSYPADDVTEGLEDGAGSMGTDEGMGSGADTHGGASSHGGSTGGGNSNGGGSNGGGSNGGSTNGTGESGGLMEDVTDGLEQIGEDITGAVDDAADGSRTRR